MRKVLLVDSRPDLASQVVDKSLLYNLGISASEKIRWRCEHGHEWDATVKTRVGKGSGCPYCSGRYAIPGENDLGTVRPDIAAQLVDESLASTLKPTSHRKVEWKCENGHVWTATVSSRVSDGAGCPYCSGRRAWPGETDLATTHPELAAQLVDQSLGKTLSRGSNKVVSWKCPTCGHVWDASVNSRVHMGSGCPRCAGKVLVKGENDLVSLYPDIAAEMVDQSLAQRTFVYSNRKVKWRCKHGHEWEAVVSSRTMHGIGCPYCSGRRTLVGENDLAVVRPDLVAEMVNPEDAVGLHVKSHRKVRWKCSHGHEWDAIVSNRVQFGYGCPICAASRGESDVEIAFADMVSDLVGVDAVERSNRSVLGGRELDVVVAERNAAFEFNGIYWHSRKFGDVKAYDHIDKAEVCAMHGIRMFVVWEDDWVERECAVRDYVSLALGCMQTASGDVCMRELTEQDAMAFCTLHSLDRKVSFSRYVGVFAGEQLVCVIGGDVCEEGALCVRVLGMSSDVSGHVRDAASYMAQLFGMSGTVVVRTWSDRGYEDASVYRDFGFVAYGYGDTKHYLVHACVPWDRCLCDDVADGAKDGETGWHEICDSGVIKWQMELT